jgi:hypothetical protein
MMKETNMKKTITIVVGGVLLIVVGVINSPYIIYRYISRRRQGRAFMDEEDMAAELEELKSRGSS